MTVPSLKISVAYKIEIMDEKDTYRSNIQDVGRNGILIDTPVAGNKYYIMHKGGVIEYLLCAEKEVYRCTSTVLGKTKENNLELIVLSTPKIIEKIQRREFYRLPIVLNIKYYVLSNDKNYASLKDVPKGYISNMKDTISIDISGGGMRFISKEKINKNDFIVTSINIDGETLILGKVVRSEYDNLNRNYKVGIRFEGMDSKTREIIIRFIFAKSREQGKFLK